MTRKWATGRLWKSYGFILIWILPGFLCRGPCFLPPTWTGEWFESGQRDIVKITRNNVTHKGKCVQNQDSRYIFRDNSAGCHRCVSMHHKHPSVLQYKESKCVSGIRPGAWRKQLQICRSISVDDPLVSLFRVNAAPEHCAIGGTFEFSYSMGHGLCAYPMSSISQCSDKSRLMFRYQACADIKGSESREETATCVASWKEGSTYYFLARMNHSWVGEGDFEKSFRCFVYKRQFSGFLLAQSGEAKCNLYTATEGYRTMELKEVESRTSQCFLPGWIRQHRHYRSLGPLKDFHVNHLGTSLSIKGVDRSLNMVCQKIHNDNNNYTKITMEVEVDCESGFNCLEVFKKSADVFSIRVGKISRNADEACHPDLFFDHSLPYSTITTARLQPKPCPLVGRYKVDRRGEPDCGETPSFLLGGCSKPDRIKMVVQCDRDVKKSFSSDMVCYDSWRENDSSDVTEYTIASPASRPSVSSKMVCLMSERNSSSGVIQLKASQECFSKSHPPLWSYTAKKEGSCAPKALATANRGCKFSVYWILAAISGSLAAL